MTPRWNRAERLKKDRDQSGRQEGEEDIALDLDERPQTNDEEHIQADDAQGQCPINQGAIDDEVNIPQPIAQDGDPKGERGKELKEKAHLIDAKQ